MFGLWNNWTDCDTKIKDEVNNMECDLCQMYQNLIDKEDDRFKPHLLKDLENHRRCSH